MARKILIMGLPGRGKTTLAKLLAPMFNAVWLNADKVREEVNDWDFTPTGRTRQTDRMKTYAQKALDDNRNVIADFICPTEQTRRDVDADYIIWMDTIKEGRFEDTNKMFEPPIFYNFRVTHKDASMWAFLIKKDMEKTLRGVGRHD